MLLYRRFTYLVEVGRGVREDGLRDWFGLGGR